MSIIMSTQIHKLSKIFYITAVCAAVFCFGEYFGPSNNTVDAMVFEKLLDFAEDMPAYLFDNRQGAPRRKTRMNGNTFYLTAGKTRDAIPDVLDFYAKQYRPLSPHLKNDAALRKTLGDESKVAAAKVIYRFLDCMSEGQNYRFEGERFGFLGAFEFKNKEVEVGSPEYEEMVSSAVEAGEIGKIGTGRVVIAVSSENSKETLVVNIWTDTDLNLNNFIPDKDGDMPGKDMDDIPRPGGSQRLFSIGQENSESLDSVIIYRSDGSVIAQYSYYRSVMVNHGWQLDSKFDAVMKDNHHDGILFFTKRNKECTIQVDKNADSGKVLTTVMVREQSI